MPRSGFYTGDLSTENKAKNFVNTLINGDLNLSTCLSDFEVSSALFLQKNDTFMRAMRAAFRDKLAELSEKLQKSEDVEEILNRALCLLPLASIKPDQIYTIPTYVDSDSTWQNYDYVVSPIELSPTYGIGRLVLTDRDRLFAYGLTPLKTAKENDFIPPRRLIFTDPYPGQQGYLASLYMRFQFIANFYSSCQAQISAWLDVTAPKQDEIQPDTIVYGIGNASRIALETVYIDKAQYLKEVKIIDAYSTSYSIRQDYETKWKALSNKPNVSVQMHKDHYNLGEIINDWHVTDANKQNLTGKYFKNWNRNLLAGSVLGGLVNTLLVMPSQYIFIPLIRTILQHKMQLALLSILTMVFIMLPGLIMTDIGTALAVFTAGYFAFKMIEPIKTLFNCHEKKEALCHEIDTLELIQEQDKTRRALFEPG